MTKKKVIYAEIFYAEYFFYLSLIRLKQPITMRFRDFLVTYSVVATAVGYIIGEAMSGIFKSWTEDVIMPFFDTWFESKNRTINIFGAKIHFRNVLIHIVNFFTTMFTLWFLIHYVGSYTLRISSRITKSIGQTGPLKPLKFQK